MSNRYFKIFVVVVGDNCKTPAETFCPGDRKVLADRLATNHILLQTISADENYISTSYIQIQKHFLPGK